MSGKCSSCRVRPARQKKPRGAEIADEGTILLKKRPGVHAPGETRFSISALGPLKGPRMRGARERLDARSIGGAARAEQSDLDRVGLMVVDPPAIEECSTCSARQRGYLRSGLFQQPAIVDADPVAAHVRELMADRVQWTGSASDLLQAGTNRPGWPKSARALAGRLRRTQTFLRILGIEIVFGRQGRLGTRTIAITAVAESRPRNIVSKVSIVSRVGDNGRGADVKDPPPGLEQSL